MQIHNKVKLSICNMQRLCGMVDQPENVTSELPLDHYRIIEIKLQMHMSAGRESLFETLHQEILSSNTFIQCAKCVIYCKIMPLKGFEQGRHHPPEPPNKSPLVPFTL